MTLHLVIHRPAAPAGGEPEAAERTALREAVWEVADSHWAPTEETLMVSCDLSAAYLLSHFKVALARRGHADPGFLLVVPMGAEAAWTGLPQDGEAWIKDLL